MKKVLLGLVVACALLAVPMAASAQATSWDSHFKSGDLSLSVGVGLGYGLSVAIYPGVEFTFAEWRIGDTVPLAFGGAVKGMVNFYPGFWTAFGGGGFGTVHLGLKGLDLPDFLQRFDFYWGIGVALSYFSWTGTYGGLFGGSNVNFGFATMGGTNYFITDGIAIYLEGNYWAYYGGGALGVLFKL